VTVYRGDTRVWVEVKDDGSEQAPVAHRGGKHRESGFGLELLELMELMADRWAALWRAAGSGCVVQARAEDERLKPVAANGPR
jgi:hypothetical protein